jgi:hypothetical protein
MSHDPNNPDCPWNQPTPTGLSVRCGCTGVYVKPEPDKSNVCPYCGGYRDEEEAQCHNCWSVQEYLAPFIKSPAGRAFVIRALQEQATEQSAQRDESYPSTPTDDPNSDDPWSFRHCYG